MTTVTYSQTRQNLKTIFDKVVNDSEPIFVKRRNNSNVVILSEDDYRSLNETAYLLASPKNRKHLEKGISNLEKGEYETFDSLEELENAI